mmetsp:Transcript_18697/g.27050  ORF Transcript_18697/g.27050 Transcript_18697/m.27050 type:complete len:364 (+) Transcript_18697:86-1177(+)
MAASAAAVINFFDRFWNRLTAGDAWKSGFLSAMALTASVGCIASALPLWNFRLNFVMNLVNVIDIRTGLLFSKLHRTKEADLASINRFRREQHMLPLGPVRKMKSTEKTSMVSRFGHSIPLYVFTPIDHTEGSPMIIYYHGGGFVIGDVLFYESVLTFIAQETGCVVIGVDYRKAPENKFPAAPLDCIESTEWIIAHAENFGCDSSRVCVMGDSAGGHLAAIVARELQDRVSLSIPIYPVIYWGVLSQSKHDNSMQPVLSSALMEWFSLRYFTSRDEMCHPLANPLSGDVSKLPRTHIITAEFDCLRDEGLEYMLKLQSAGVNVSYKQYNNTCHGFFGAEYLATHGRQAVVDISNVIRMHFGL